LIVRRHPAVERGERFGATIGESHHCRLPTSVTLLQVEATSQ
jgi:hypothetical protein